MSHRDLARWATSLSVSSEEIRSIERQVLQKHQGVHIVRFDHWQNGSIAVSLADKPDRPYGLIVTFRKVGNQWVEDPESSGKWAY